MTDGGYLKKNIDKIMPYIKKEDRTKYDALIKEITDLLINGDYFEQSHPSRNEVKVGEVNYIISSIIWEIFKKERSYTMGNNLVGVLECVKQEFYRRQLSNYEDEKIKENGDIQ
jgi:broad-specificity NMP kinase